MSWYTFTHNDECFGYFPHFSSKSTRFFMTQCCINLFGWHCKVSQYIQVCRDQFQFISQVYVRRYLSMFFILPWYHNHLIIYQCGFKLLHLYSTLLIKYHYKYKNNSVTWICITCYRIEHTLILLIGNPVFSGSFDSLNQDIILWVALL